VTKINWLGFEVKGQGHSMTKYAKKYNFCGLFPQFLWYALKDFLQTSVVNAS